ncbi:MAG: TetR/AcrR family transcriptional regulator [Arachnia sp.]
MTLTPRHRRRRAALVSAARAVAAERGLSATHVRAVAAKADVSVGSVLYYFPSFEDLLYLSVEEVLEEFYEQRRLLTERLDDPVARLRALVVAGIPDEIPKDLRVVYESVGLVREKPHYRPLMRSIVERQVLLYRTTIEIGVGVGAFTPTRAVPEIARNIVALEDAYDLYPLVGVDVDRESCRRAVLAYAAQALNVDIEVD